MSLPMHLALTPGETPLEPDLASEPWVTPDQLANADASETVDMMSVCRVASEILFVLSGRQFGVRTERVRPDLGGCASKTVPLKAPVRNIQQVKVDGVVIPPEQYEVINGRELLRLKDANGNVMLWPGYQQMSYADTERDTFSIYYQWGHSVPQGGMLAAQTFAIELAKYLNKDRDCALPDRTVQVSRQGVTQVLIDPSEFIKVGKVGLYMVDIWLGTVNPSGRRRRPTITSPDSPRLRRTT